MEELCPLCGLEKLICSWCSRYMPSEKNCKVCRLPLFETLGGQWRHIDGRDYWGVACLPCGWSWSVERLESFKKDNPGKKVRCGKCKSDRDLVYGHTAVLAEMEAAK